MAQETKQTKCELCNKRKARYRFGRKYICRPCYEEIGKGFDELSIRTIAKRWGRKWIEDILDKL